MRQTREGVPPNKTPSRSRCRALLTGGVAALIAVVAFAGAWNTDGLVSVVLSIGFFAAVATVGGAGQELFVFREPLANAETRSAAPSCTRCRS